MPISKLHSILADTNLLAHNNRGQICYWSQISLQSDPVICSFSNSLISFGVPFILLAMLSFNRLINLNNSTRSLLYIKIRNISLKIFPPFLNEKECSDHKEISIVIDNGEPHLSWLVLKDCRGEDIWLIYF